MKFFTVDDVPRKIDINEFEREIYEERAAIMEHVGNLPRAQAEKQAKVLARKQLARDITFVLKPHWKGERPK